MNIQTDGQTVTVTMTVKEAEEMKKAYRWAKLYWQRIASEETGEHCQDIANRIGKGYALTHNKIADIIGY